MPIVKRTLLTAALAALLAPAASHAADFLGKSAAAWARDLTSEKAEVRRSAAFALGKTGAGQDSDLTALAGLVQKDRDQGVREAAAAAIGDIVAAQKGTGGGRWARPGPPSAPPSPTARRN